MGCVEDDRILKEGKQVSSTNMAQPTLSRWLFEPTNNTRGLSYILVLYVLSNMRTSPEAT
ncbi:hypothetical protein GBA52_008757 [Prunus armeniaca]|nr:hypothetical protein GBA52_008757 [Prunus armeniaca]